MHVEIPSDGGDTFLTVAPLPTIWDGLGITVGPMPLEPIDPLLSTQANSSNDAEARSSAHTVASLLPRGAVINKYVVVDYLGEGGMGVVYSAYDPVLDRKIALKLLRIDRADSNTQDARARLLREAQAMARLAHPNVLTVHEVGTVDDQIFIAMELVDGGTLRRWIEERERPLREVIDVFLQAGRGLLAAHAVGLVHRDFKPDNVLLGKNGRVYVADFGLVSQIDPSGQVAEALAPRPPPPALGDIQQAAISATLTQTGAIIGTPAYMSPEQGQAQPTDERTDQFSYCVALYEAVCRQRPFAGDDVLSILQSAIAGRIREPPKGRRVPQRILRILHRGLSPLPDDRYPSMEALLADLQGTPRQVTVSVLVAVVALALLGWAGSAYLGLKPAQKGTCQIIEERFERVWTEGRKRALWAAFHATGKPYAESSAREVERALSAYAAAWRATHKEACQTGQAHGPQAQARFNERLGCLNQRLQEAQSLLDVFEQADGVVVEKAVPAVHALINVRRCADQEALAASLPPPPPGEGRQEQIAALRAQLAEVKARRDAGKYEAGLALAAQALATGRQLGYRPVEAEALLLLGELQAQAGQPIEAEETLYQAVFAADAGRHSAVAAKAAAQLVQVLGFQRSLFPLAHHWARHADARIEGLGSNSELSALLSHHHAQVYNAQGQYPEALALSLKAVDLGRRSFGSEHFRLIEPLRTTGSILLNLGRHDEALRHVHEALAIGTRSLGESHTLVASTLSTLGGVYLLLDRFDEAQQHFQRALTITQRALGPAHPDVGYSLFGLSSTFLRQGQYEEGLRYSDEVADILKGSLGQQTVRFAATLSNSGYALVRLKRYEQVLLRAERALSLLENQQVHQGLLHRGYALMVLGEAYVGLGAPHKAREPLEAAHSLFAASRADKDALALTRFALARAIWDADINGNGNRNGNRNGDGEAVRKRARSLAWQARDGLSERFDPKLRTQLQDWLARFDAR